MLLYEWGHTEQLVLPEITWWDVPRGRNETGVLYTSRLQAWLSFMGQIGQGVDFQIIYRGRTPILRKKTAK